MAWTTNQKIEAAAGVGAVIALVIGGGLWATRKREVSAILSRADSIPSWQSLYAALFNETNQLVTSGFVENPNFTGVNNRYPPLSSAVVKAKNAQYRYTIYDNRGVILFTRLVNLSTDIHLSLEYVDFNKIRDIYMPED